MPPEAGRPCPICNAESRYIGDKTGRFKARTFHVFRCFSCHFVFVANPWLDFHEIYSEAYYRGQGADPLVDYVFEMEQPAETVRQYEWAGILRALGSCAGVNAASRWLDFGCGNGGLVRYVRQHAECSIFGFDEGWISERARQQGTPILLREDLSSLRGSFDIVTAIEVLEHVPDPLSELMTIRSLLKTGGVFFYTTGNAAPHASKILKWPYLIPELHISLFEPITLQWALEKTGFRAEFLGFIPGLEDIIRYKILKTLKIRKVASWERVLPWNLIARLVDSRLQVSGHPVGRAEQ